MYTEQELLDVAKEKKRRIFITLIPTVLVFLIAVAIFVYGQITRSQTLWVITVLLTIISWGALLFLYGTWIKPARLYQRHIHYMLHGKQVITTGYLKEISDIISIQDSLPFYSILINVGEKDDPEDDRLFYYDAQKENIPFAIGTKITVSSNDRKISNIEEAE